VLAELAAVIGTPGGVVADLAQSSDVQGAVELAVPQAAQAVALEVPAGHLDRGGTVVGREVAGRGEAGDITDVADDQGGDDWTDSAELGQARGARLDRGRGLLGVIGQRTVQSAHVGEQVTGQALSDPRDRSRGSDAAEQRGCCGRRQLPLGAASHQFTKQRVQPVQRPGALLVEVVSAVGKQAQDHRIALGGHPAQAAAPDGSVGH
jgi:hypothetical protein